MNEEIPVREYYVGWDVGGWNCDRNSRSRDALVVLDEQRQIVGVPWRGNLRTVIGEANTATDWMGALFGLCQIDDGAEPNHMSSGRESNYGRYATGLIERSDLLSSLRACDSSFQNSYTPQLCMFNHVEITSLSGLLPTATRLNLRESLNLLPVTTLVELRPTDVASRLLCP